MKTIFITGNHPRHIYLVKKFSKFFKNFKWIVEVREINRNHTILKKKSKIYKKHISDFKKKEKIFFKNTNKFIKKNSRKISIVNRKKSNNLKFNKIIINEVKLFEPQILFSYGCQKIDIKNLKKNTKNLKGFNIHGGLLPKYRGVNTNFWPHWNLESNFIGLTMHDLTDKIDTGDIFYQTSTTIENDSTINSLSCKATKIFCNIVPRKIYMSLKKNFNLKGIKYKTRSKLWKKKDFKPKDIKVAYENFKLFIKNKKYKIKPKLININ